LHVPGTGSHSFVLNVGLIKLEYACRMFLLKMRRKYLILVQIERYKKDEIYTYIHMVTYIQMYIQMANMANIFREALVFYTHYYFIIRKIFTVIIIGKAVGS